MEVTCRWTRLPEPCKDAEWLVGFLCDKCYSTDVIELCDAHYAFIKETIASMGVGCACRGQMSMMVALIADNLDEWRQDYWTPGRR